MPAANVNYGPLCRVTRAELPSISSSRSDGRSSINALRPIFLRGSVLSGAAGSSLFESGGTKVFVAVHGPRASANAHSIDAVLHCEVRWADFAGRGDRARTKPGDTPALTDEERDLSTALSRTLRAVARLEAYPKSRIDVAAFVLEDDGGAFAAVLTAAAVALADAGIEMKDLVGGCAAGVMDGRVILDPCAEEEARCDGLVMVAYTAAGGSVADLLQTGEVSVELVHEAIRLCCSGAAQICGLVRMCLEKQAKKVMKKRAKAQPELI